MSEYEVSPRIFLTDYGSYNQGRQFEFGHWVDMEKFDTYEELMEYISNHFKECDQKSPLYGCPREEIMITDFEGFPRALYCECGNLEQVMAYLSMVEESSYDSEVYESYLAMHDMPGTIAELEEQVESAYMGEFTSKIDFAHFVFEDHEIPEGLPYSCIDWNWVARDLDFTSHNGHYFMS